MSKSWAEELQNIWHCSDSPPDKAISIAFKLVCLQLIISIVLLLSFNERNSHHI